MDATWKAKWVAALRSGEYKQGRGRLRSEDDEYCCLGVLCEIAAQVGVIERAAPPPNTSSVAWRYGGWHDYLPMSLADVVRLDTYNPTIEDVQLTNMNDEGKSFLEIADLIEKHL